MNWCWCMWHLFDNVFQQNCEDMIWTTLIIVWKVLSLFFSYLFFPACFCWKGWSLAYWQLGPFATAVGCLSRPWNMNNQDQCDLTICCPYPTVLTAFRRKAACLSSFKARLGTFLRFLRGKWHTNIFPPGESFATVQLTTLSWWCPPLDITWLFRAHIRVSYNFYNSTKLHCFFTSTTEIGSLLPNLAQVFLPIPALGVW